MKKLCGCLEPCFVNGEGVWGHWGGTLCLHAGEYVTGCGSASMCNLTKEPVQHYISKFQYECAKKCCRCENNTEECLPSACVDCKWFYDSIKENLVDNFKEGECFELL